MGKIKIINKDLLIEIFKRISWLDNQRWKYYENYNFINFFSNDLKNHEKILTHWICYIADRQMPFEKVWDKGGYVFSELVCQYVRNDKTDPQKILNKYYEEYKENKFRFRSKTDNNITFASRFITEDYENILQTLEILDKYEVNINGKKFRRNIVAFVLHFLERFNNENDRLIRVACALYLLTYNLNRKKADTDNVIEILKDNKKFEEALKEFKKDSTKGKKRLWCCIRDYKKGFYKKIFCDAIKDITSDEIMKELWENLPMEQLELPGDVWNNNYLFRDNLFAKVLNLNAIPESWKMPQIIRDIYEQLKNDVQEEIKGFYPEQFDITFDFVPRMCSKKMCNVCLFRENGVDKICIPTKDKYCPVALLSCGYVTECEEENCIIKQNKSKGICEGINNHSSPEGKQLCQKAGKEGEEFGEEV